MAGACRWALIGAVVGIVGVAPVVCFRASYAHDKRLREVEPGRFYRSGQLTAEGFAEVKERLGIKTVLNVQDDYPDPDIARSFWDWRTVKEHELCERLNMRYVTIAPDLVARHEVPGRRPAAVDQFLALMDDESNYPVLIHCRAGLHRTGILTAVYRMEYQGWSPAAAFAELKAHGFGPFACTAANDYVKQYVLTYRPGQRRPAESAHARAPAAP
jgi:protein tyrosine/serine phosphatase